MIDQAIAASKKEWLDAAAEARRARGTSLPVTPAPSPLHGGGARAAAKHDVVDLCSSSDEEPSVGRSVDGLGPAAAAVPPLLKGDSVVLAPTASACARREGPLQAGAFGTIVAVDKTNESDDEPYQVLAGDGISGGRKYWYRATDLLGATTAAGAGDGVLGAAAAAGAGDGLLKREAIALKRPVPDSADDDDCVVFEPRAEPSRKRPAAANAASSSVASDDDDVVMEGSTGANALVDFPHARENCVNNRFVAGNFARTCANCFCYVCDAPASACQQWSQHCSATHTEPRWRRERERQKQATLAPASAPAAVAAAAAAAAAAPAAAVSRLAGRRPSPHDDQDLVISCECMMRRVEQVWPVETPAPRGLRSVQLRPYQRQSLAFMLELERAPAGADTIGSTEHMDRGRLCPTKHTGLPVRGGWLTDEVGMGKTMVCLALVLANPLPAARQSAWDIDPTRDFKSEQKNVFTKTGPRSWEKRITSTRMVLTDECSPALTGRYKHKKMQLKTTLILTKNSLLGQWKDEIEKYAPGLTVAMFHSGTSSSERNKICSGKMDLSRVDIVLGTPGTKLPHWLRYCSTFHRVIVDESHEQIGTPPHSSFRWAVTGTPMTTAFSNLVGQARFLGQSGVRAGPELFFQKGSYGKKKLVMLGAEQFQRQYCHSLGDTMASYLDVLPKVSDPEYCADPAPVFNVLLQRLKKLMIRHTKAQRIRCVLCLNSALFHGLRSISIVYRPCCRLEYIYIYMVNMSQSRVSQIRFSNGGRDLQTALLV